MEQRINEKLNRDELLLTYMIAYNDYQTVEELSYHSGIPFKRCNAIIKQLEKKLQIN